MDAVNTRVRGAFASYRLALILLAALLAFTGCGGGSESSSSSEESAEAGSVGEETSETAGETTGEPTDETSGETSGSTKPYTAIVASAESQYTEESGSGSPDEVLVDGAQDLSDGPLKDNRLVAYYGNPREAAMGVLGETDPETMMVNLKE